jgi:predicted 3-demethylubiquinone-9 3-methyltransferase (glyoxalase superfamily)
MTTMLPFLMFEGRAEEAMTRYVSTIPDSRVLLTERYGADGPGAEGTLSHGEAVLAGQRVRFFDSPAHHEFTFTPAISFFISVDAEDDVDRIAEALVVGGNFLMPVGDYGFSRRFAWLNDEFGVSWQINAE